MIKIQNIPAVSDFESQGKRLYHKMYLIPEDDVDFSTLPEIVITETARTIAALPLKKDAKFIEINFAKHTLGETSEGSAGDITSEVTNTLTGTIAGDRVAINNLIENSIGVNFFCIVVDRYTQKKMLYGRPYAPMLLSSFSRRKNAENASCDVTFTSPYMFQPLEYLGSVTTVVDEP